MITLYLGLLEVLLGVLVLLVLGLHGGLTQGVPSVELEALVVALKPLAPAYGPAHAVGHS